MEGKSIFTQQLKARSFTVLLLSLMCCPVRPSFAASTVFLDNGNGKTSCAYDSIRIAANGVANVTCGASTNAPPTMTLLGASASQCEYQLISWDSSGAAKAYCASLPGAPEITSISPSGGSISVTFKPTTSGASSIDYYRLTCTPSSGAEVKTAQGPGPVLKVSGLLASSVYRCSVSAHNSLGDSPMSTVTSVNTSSSTVQVPGAPVAVTAKPGKGRAILTFTAPASDGGATIASYIATCALAGGASHTATGLSPLTVGGLAGAKTYSCSVAAVNDAGTGASSSSLSVMPERFDLTPAMMLLLD